MGVRVHRVQVDGHRLVAKSAHGRARSLVRREAELLSALDGTPVTPMVALRESDDRTDLVTEDAGQRHLARPDGLSPDTLLAAVASAGAALAELHAAGWSHGAVCGEHLVVDDDGVVTLCSLGSARPTGDDPDAIVEDLSQLRAVIDRLGAHRDPGWTRAMAREWRARHRRLVHPDRGGMSRPTGALIGGAVALGLASLALGAVSSDHGESDATAAVTPVSDRTMPVPGPTTTGQLLRFDGRTYRAGRPGDVIALDDANCIGRPRALLLRPGTGELFEFDRWPAPHRPVHARLRLVVHGAERLETVEHDDGCDRARLVHRDGSTSEVPPPPADPTHGAPPP